MNKFITIILIFFCSIHSSNAANSEKKIISVGGSLTEILYALEAQDSIIAVDTTSYYPKETSNLKKVGYQKSLSTEGILSLSPTTIIFTEEAGPKNVLNQLSKLNIEMLEFKNPRTMEDVYKNITKLGELVNKEENATKLIEKTKNELKQIETKVKTIKDNSGNIKNIIFLMTHSSPPLTAGLYTPADTIIKLAGVTNSASSHYGYKPLVSESLVKSNPDIILVTSDYLRKYSTMENFLKTNRLDITNAGKNRKVIDLDSLEILTLGVRTPEVINKIIDNYNN